MAAWTEEEDATLRRLWSAGQVAEVIGGKIGRSKNSVIGRAHRLQLELRQTSPVTKAASERKAAPKRDHAAEKAARAERSAMQRETVARRVAMRQAQAAEVEARRAEPRPVVVAPVVVVPPPAPVAPRRPLASGCCWPMGEPRTAGFRYCDAARYVARSPYCAAHHSVAYKSRAASPAWDGMPARVAGEGGSPTPTLAGLPLAHRGAAQADTVRTAGGDGSGNSMIPAGCDN